MSIGKLIASNRSYVAPYTFSNQGHALLLIWHATHRDLNHIIVGHVFLDTCLVTALVKHRNLVLDIYDFHCDSRGCQAIIGGSIPRSHHEFIFLRNLRKCRNKVPEKQNKKEISNSQFT